MASMRSTRVRLTRGRLLAFGALAAIVPLVATIGLLTGGTRGTPELPVQVIYASWATGYGSTAEMGNGADLVVVGTVTGVASEGADASSPRVAATRYTVAIDRLIKGASGKSIIVKQTGGVLGSVKQVVDDDPLMVVGTRYLLYLAQVREGPYAGDYWVLGGAQGRFGVGSGGRLTPMGSVAAPAGASADTITAQQ